MASPSCEEKTLPVANAMNEASGAWKHLGFLGMAFLALAYIVGSGVALVAPIVVGGWFLPIPFAAPVFFAFLRAIGLGTALAVPLALGTQFVFFGRREGIRMGEQAGFMPVICTLAVNVLRLIPTTLLFPFLLVCIPVVGAVGFYSFASARLMWQTLRRQDKKEYLWTEWFGGISCLLLVTLPVLSGIALLVWLWWAMSSGPH